MSDAVPVTFVLADGERREVEAKIGESVMLAARAGDVPGIVATCGGAAMCATCHVYVAEPYAAGLPAVEPDEDGLLGFTMAERKVNSRLSCQVVVTAALSGVEIHVPDVQV